MLTTSLKTLDDIRTGNLFALPTEFTFDAWVKAWSTACSGVECGGLKNNFMNSVSFVLPAVAISIGCFIPFQVILLPMAQTLGYLGIANSIAGLIFVHVVYGIAFTTLFFRNFYVSVPTELTKAARIDGAGFFTIFWRIILPLSPPIIVVCVIWQFTQIWNDFLFGVVFSSGERQPITVALNNLVNTSTGVKEYNVDMAAAIIAGLPTLFVYIVAGKYFLRGLTAGAVKG